MNPWLPTGAVLGLTKESVDEAVWMERFVLYWEQADATPHATIARISHLREYIRTLSSQAIRRKTGQEKLISGRSAAHAIIDQSIRVLSIGVLMKSAIILFRACFKISLSESKERIDPRGSAAARDLE